jgi:formylglycine-generating enzyme required for sulfatase activity
MSGNELEWCWDWYVDYLAPPYILAGSPYLGGTDPRGPESGYASQRIARGGSWGSYAEFSRCCTRGSFNPSNVGDNFGFRCVRGF